MARASRERDWLMILVGYYHALRAGEIVALTRDNVQGDRLIVARLKGSQKTDQALIRDPDPLWSEREVLIDFAAKSKGNQRLFDIGKRRFEYLFLEYSELAGIPRHKAHPHVLKHSCCTHLRENGADIKIIQEWAGHQSLASTGVYMGLTQAQVDGEVGKAFAL